jgi:heme/copper-type cytochrome/quinol oxidase subunit 2
VLDFLNSFARSNTAVIVMVIVLVAIVLTIVFSATYRLDRAVDPRSPETKT